MEVVDMDRKTTGIVAYLTIVGWFVAYFIGDREGAKFHLNQGLVVGLALVILGVLGWMPIIGWVARILALAVAVCAILGVVYAYQDQEKEIPLLGIIKLLK